MMPIRFDDVRYLGGHPAVDHSVEGSLHFFHDVVELWEESLEDGRLKIPYAFIKSARVIDGHDAPAVAGDLGPLPDGVFLVLQGHEGETVVIEIVTTGTVDAVRGDLAEFLAAFPELEVEPGPDSSEPAVATAVSALSSYDLRLWSDAQRQALTGRLVESGIPHGWTDTTLNVAPEDKVVVDEIVEGIDSLDQDPPEAHSDGSATPSPATELAHDAARMTQPRPAAAESTAPENPPDVAVTAVGGSRRLTPTIWLALLVALLVAVGILAVISSRSDETATQGSQVTESVSTEGNADAESPPTTTVEIEFSTELNDLCASKKAATDVAGADLQSALEELKAATDNGDDAAYATALDNAETATEDAIRAFVRFQASVNELDVPAEAEAALSDLVDTVDETQALTQDLRDAIAVDDGDAFTDADNALQDASAATDQAQADAAAALDAPDCAPDDS